MVSNYGSISIIEYWDHRRNVGVLKTRESAYVNTAGFKVPSFRGNKHAWQGEYYLSAPRHGLAAPDFDLKSAYGNGVIHRSDLRSQPPSVSIFGNATLIALDGIGLAAQARPVPAPAGRSRIALSERKVTYAF